MAEVYWRKGYECVGPVEGNKYGINPSKYWREYLVGEDSNGYVTVWIGSCARGAHAAENFEEFEKELCRAFREVYISAFSVHMKYAKEIRINR